MFYLGKIDTLINCAGISKPFRKTTSDHNSGETACLPLSSLDLPLTSQLLAVPDVQDMLDSVEE